MPVIILIFAAAFIAITCSIREWNRTCAEAKRKLEAQKNRPIEGLSIIRRPE